MNEPPEKLINVFGALALGVSDRIRRAVIDPTGPGGEIAAAVVVIGHASGLSIDQLGRVLGLSHPGAVRLVDRLAKAGLAARSASAHDRRAVALALTAEGEARRAALLEQRRMILAGILKEVAEEDQAVLQRLTEAMLRKLPGDAITALAVCRYCDQGRCAECPMEGFNSLLITPAAQHP